MNYLEIYNLTAYGLNLTFYWLNLTRSDVQGGDGVRVEGF